MSTATQPHHKGKVLLRLEATRLIIANTGKAFSKRGFDAVCNAHRSSKNSEKTHDADTQEAKGTESRENEGFSDENEAKKLLKKLRDARLESYATIPGDMEEHAKGENSLQTEYESRALLELLQNAHDAAGAGSLDIGEKGIGFKGVLNISREHLSVHSGHLHFGFSIEKTRKALEDKKLPTEHIPTMRLPFWKES